MANQAEFDSGYQQGYDVLAQKRAHKQALSDEELQGKISTLIDNRKAIQGKLPLLLDDKGNPTPQYNDAIQQLTQNARDLREVYHPDKQPGAIEKFGHLLTDALHVTKPEDRIAKEGQKRATAAAGDEKTALGVAAAAPVSPEQAATQQGRAESAKSLAEFQGNMKLYDQNHPEGVGPNATPEGKQARQEYINELINSTSGVKETKPIAENFVPVELLLSDGTKISGQRGKDGAYEYLDRTPIPPELLHGAKIESTAKPSTGTLNERFASYARDHDLPEGKMLSGPQMDYVKQKWTLDGLYPTSTTTTTFKENLKGQWVPVTETNYRTPGGNITLVDPLGPVQSSTPDNKKDAQLPNAEPTKKTTHADIKKQAEKLKTTSTGSGPGNVRVGQPILQGATPASKKADDEILEASNIDNLATIAEKAPQNMKAEKTRFLLGRLQKVMEGRFNQGAYENLSTKYGWDNTFQGWLNHISTGQLPDEIFKAIVSEAHDNLSSAVKAKQDLVANMKEDGGSDSSNASGGTQEFNENGKIYDIPADKVEAFKKKHPKAKEQ